MIRGLGGDTIVVTLSSGGETTFPWMQKDLNPMINFPFHYVFPASARPRSADYESCVQTPAIRKKRRRLPSKSWRIAAPPPRRVAHSEHICMANRGGFIGGL